MNSAHNRRNFLKQSAFGVGALAGLPSLGNPQFAFASDKTSRIEALELRPVEVARSAVVPTEAQDDGTLAEMRALLEAMKTDRGDLPTNFHASVASAIEDIRAVEDAERDRERAERNADRIADRVSELTVELGLSTQQASQLHDQMVVYEDKRNEMRDLAREAGDWGAARQGFRDLRDERDTELQKIFTADQFARYEELDDDDRRGRGGRGGDDNGGGGGGRRGSRGS